MIPSNYFNVLCCPGGRNLHLDIAAALNFAWPLCSEDLAVMA